MTRPTASPHPFAYGPDRRSAELERYAIMCDAMPLAAAVFDATLTLEYANTRFRHLIAPAPAAGTDPAPPSRAGDDAPTLARVLAGATGDVNALLAAAASHRTVQGVRLRFAEPDGFRIVEVMVTPLGDASLPRRPMAFFAADTTEQSRLARELEAQLHRSATLYRRVSTEAERLEQMVTARSNELLEIQEARERERRLVAVGQVAAGVLHDLNNALNPIMAAAYLLPLRADDASAVRDYAARIAKAAETAAATAARVGRFIRQEPVHATDLERLDLSRLAADVLDMTESQWSVRTLGAPVRLERALPAGLWVRGIAGELRATLLNVIANALDAMPGGGTLAVNVRADGADTVLEVRDTGVGMTAEVRDRAFEPFFSTKGRAGNGLGLSEVYGIMKRHGGRVELESQTGAGTTARLVFPTVPDESGAAPGESPAGGTAAAVEPGAGAAGSGASRRVLVVEDDAELRESLREVLKSDGHEVEMASTVSHALALLSAGHDLPWDVVLTGVQLPDGSGLDLIRTVRAYWPRVRVGVLADREEGANAADADFLLFTPVRAEQLLARVVHGGEGAR